MPLSGEQKWVLKGSSLWPCGRIGIAHETLGNRLLAGTQYMASKAKGRLVQSAISWSCKLAGLSFAAGLMACSPRLDVRGNLPDPDKVLEVQPGVHTRDQVATLLGSPSSVGTFQDDRWYYIGGQTETFAFFKPEVIEQQVLEVKFNQDGVVEDMIIFTLADGREINPVSRVTPTGGGELSFFEQLFGNLGKFNNPGGGSSLPSGNRPGGRPPGP